MTALRTATLVLFSLLILAGTAHAQWKWRDANGRVTASDRPPPPGVAEKDIIQRPSGAAVRAPMPPPPAAASAAIGRPTDTELEARKRRADEEAAARKKAEEDRAAAAKKAEEQRIAAAKADNCERARGTLRAIEDGGRIARTKPNGEREFLDDAQRAAEAQRARSLIASDCR
jgi:type IV secretory pathway VirB10-like protein